MAEPWISDLHEPRTLLLVHSLVVIVGGTAALFMLQDDGIRRALAIVWLVVVLANLIWAARDVRRLRERAASGSL